MTAFVSNSCDSPLADIEDDQSQGRSTISWSVVGSGSIQDGYRLNVQGDNVCGGLRNITHAEVEKFLFDWNFLLISTF